MNPPLVTPVFLMQYPQVPSVADYRPAIDDTGTRLVFERIVGAQEATNLYLLDLSIPDAAPQPFVPSLTDSTRPDWCWRGTSAAASPGRVAFSNGGIWLVDGCGSGLELLANTVGMVYPSWYPGGAALAVDNGSESADPNPCSTKIDTAGRVITPVLANVSIFVGMPSVNQVNPNLVAFAGQRIAADPFNPPRYDQQRNYIWVTDASTEPPTVEPLDKDAPARGPFDPRYQGRAPWWSPDGNWVAFESSRAATKDALGEYAIFIQDAAGKNPAMQVTDPKWNGQHPKWYPDGVTLVAAVSQQPGKKRFGIARLDVSGFVSA
jgi:WD40-like Beta Propeller Repeat